jgi:hypothetical protein
MSNFLATNENPVASYEGKVRAAMDYNHPAEIAYRDGRERSKAKQAAAVQYERREVVDDDATYVIEDREDGPYIIAKQQGNEPIRSFGDAGLKLDEVPESAIDKTVFDRVGEIAAGAGEVGEGAMRGIGLGTTKFITNVIRSAVDNPIGDFALGPENVEAFEQFSTEFLKNADIAANKSGITGKEFGTGGQIAVDVGDVAGQYVAPAAGLYKAYRAMGAGALLSSVLADGTVGFFGVSPEQENIANLIPEDSKAFGALRELIATDPDDGDFENRTRNAVEAIGMLGIGEVAARSIIGAVKSGKQAIKAIEVPESVGKAIDKHLPKLLGAGAATGAMAPGDAEGSVGPQSAIDTDDRFTQAMAFTRQAEGGAANVKGDRGGATLFGVSSKSFPDEYEAAKKLLKTKGEDAARAYLEETVYSGIWQDVVTEDMNARQAAVIFDAAVHHGPDRARKMFDQAQGDPAKMLDIRQAFVRQIAARDPSQLKFLKGWNNRIRDLKSATRSDGIQVAAAGNMGFQLLAEDMANPNLKLAGGKTDLIKRGIQKLDELSRPAEKALVPSETLDKAGKLITQPGERIVPEDVVTRARAALESTGKAEGIDFNLSRMETPDQLNNLIDEISEVYKEPIAKNKRGVETFDDTQAKADLSRQMGFNVDEVLSRQPGELWPAHKIKAARDIFVSELTKTDDLARSIKAGGNSSENMIAFRRQLAVVSALQSQIKGVQTETARALSQYRMTAKSAMERQVNIAEMVQKSGGAETNEMLVDAYLNVLENGGPDAAAVFARNAEQVSGPDMLFEAWINSLLGSPATHAVNMVGNSLTINQAVIERYAAATYGAAERGAARALGKEATQGVSFSEANAFAQGQAMATNDAMVAFLKAMRSGEGSDIFGKMDYTPSITAQNINELPLAKTITSKFMQGDELVKSNSQLAHMIDFMGEYYYRLPGRFLMAEDEFFKTMNYRAQLHALAAREAFQTGASKEAQAARLQEILADPQLNAPEVHREALEFAREQTFTTPPGEVAQKLSGFLNTARVGNVPAGRVVVPFFNVINNITKYTTARVPGLALVNPNSKTYKDFFSPDPAKRQLVMGKWATGGSLLGFGAWASLNGICTGRISDNFKMVSQIEQGQGKKRYACHLPGTDKMMNYNRLEPAGMLMAIAADTSNALAYVDNEEERQNLVLAATAAVVPYMQDKSFFEGISRFFEAFNPQYGDDGARSEAIGRYFSDLLATAPGAVLGPAAPGTPLSRNVKSNLFMDRAKRVAEANKWSIEKDQYGDDILVAESESYQMWDRAINKIYGSTPGLSKDLPADVNIWGEEIQYEGGLGPDLVTPIYTNTPKFDFKDLKGKNFPKQIEAGRFRDMRVGSDLTIEQHREFVKVVGIDGELERLNMPLSKPRSDISARVNGKVYGLPVELNPGDRIDLIKIMNEIRVPNDAHPDRKRMNMKETLDWMIEQKEYAMLPDDRDATGAKGDLIRKVYNEYKGAAVELFFANHPKGQAYFRKSVEMKQKAQNTGVQ